MEGRSGNGGSELTMRYAAILALALLAVPLHAEPKPHWYTSRLFWLGTAIIVGSVVADVETTQAAMRRGAHEANPIYGSYPSRPRAYGIAFALSAPNIAGLAYGESQLHPRGWWLPFTLLGSLPHLAAAAYNTTVCQPHCG